MNLTWTWLVRWVLEDLVHQTSKGSRVTVCASDAVSVQILWFQERQSREIRDASICECGLRPCTIRIETDSARKQA